MFLINHQTLKIAPSERQQGGRSVLVPLKENNQEREVTFDRNKPVSKAKDGKEIYNSCF